MVKLHDESNPSVCPRVAPWHTGRAGRALTASGENAAGAGEAAGGTQWPIDAAINAACAGVAPRLQHLLLNAEVTGVTDGRDRRLPGLGERR